MAQSELREMYLQVLMEQFRACRFPSPTMMDRLEAAIGDRESAEDYVRTIIENLSDERFPSPTMLDRARGLIDQIERFDRAG